MIYTDTPITVGTAAARYHKLAIDRQPFLDRARRASKLTIPSLIPPDGHNSVSRLPTPYQSLGARGVNNLCSKLILTLLPPNSPFFRLVIDDYALQELAGDEEVKAEVEASLLKIEKTLMGEIETSGMRPKVFEGLKHLVVGGNALFYLKPRGGVRLFHLSNYVVSRDGSGEVTEVITHELRSFGSLPDELKVAVAKTDSYMKDPLKDIDIYTWCRQVADGGFIETQEVGGIEVPDSLTRYPGDAFPYIALRWTHISGEPYGRGFVEEYEGDLISLEGLSEAIVHGAAAAARLLILVNPTGVTRQQDIARAANGAVVPGNPEDVQFLQTQKNMDLNVAAQTADTIRMELSKDFLLNSSVTRNAERVTAEEIRFLAQELEDALGGVYSLLSSELQLPLARQMLRRLQKEKRIPTVPDAVKPQVVTGLEALGRAHELNQLDVFIAGAAGQLGPEVLAQYLNPGEYLLRRANALGMNTKGLIRSEEEVQAAVQQQQQQAMAQQLTPELVKAGSKMMTQSP